MLLPLAGHVLPSPVSSGKVVVCRNKELLGFKADISPPPAGKGTQLAGGYHRTSRFRASAGTLLAGPCPRGSEAAEPFTAGKELLVGEELTELENAVTTA